MTLNIPDFNEKAQARFNDLKRKLKLDIIDREVEKGNVPNNIDTEKLKRVILETEKSDKIETTYIINEKVEEVDKTFEFIDSLQLPPQLSLAIGLIISGNKTNNLLDIESARLALKKYLYEKGFMNE